MFEKFMHTIMALICIVAVALLILIFVVLPASASYEYEPVTITRISKTFDGYIDEVVDNETGVCYMLVKYGYGTSITPMYNQNGTLKVKR